MRRLFGVAIALAACVKGNPTGTTADSGPITADAPPFVPVNGGSLTLPAPCGYMVTNRTNAEAPVPVPAGTGVNNGDPTPKDLHLGLAHDPATSIVVLWRTNDETSTPTTVQLGVASTSEMSVDGFSFGYLSSYALNSPRIRMHETHICGLTADTVYKYRAGGKGADGVEHWSPEKTFRTAPADPTSPITVVVLGDTRDGYDDWGSILARVDAQATPDLYLFTGDGVTEGAIQSEWDTFWDKATPVLDHVPILFAHGNHDANSINYYSQVALPGNESWYSIDYGAMHLDVLNDTPEDPSQIAGDQKTFLQGDLSTNVNAPWKIAMHHQPMWSNAVAHGSDVTLRAEWGPIFDTYAVDAVFNGHDHNYERSVPMVGDTVATSGGTTYVVAGSAGAILYDNGTGPSTAFSKSTENYVVVTMRTGMLTANAFDSTGTMIDTFSMTKP
jgi:hypothetical protein